MKPRTENQREATVKSNPKGLQKITLRFDDKAIDVEVAKSAPKTTREALFEIAGKLTNITSIDWKGNKLVIAHDEVTSSALIANTMIQIMRGESGLLKEKEADELITNLGIKDKGKGEGKPAAGR